VVAVRLSPHADKGIIVVDDCSTDGTAGLLRGKIAPLSGTAAVVDFGIFAVPSS
jgi:glycosyltransferase involved in cell wall biosynthesis